jgi:hypothetical protein
MQPITQANLDPPCDDTRPPRAEQEFCGATRCFGLTLPGTIPDRQRACSNAKTHRKNWNFCVRFPFWPPNRNFRITPFPKRLRERREFGARILPDCRRIIGTWPKVVAFQGDSESLKPRKTLVKVSVKANRPTFLDVGLHL